MTKLVVIAFGMFGFGFALVPFYEKICEVTGWRNVFVADAPLPSNTQVDTSRRVAIGFDSNTQRLPWTFKPLDANVSVHPGELMQVTYEVRNTLDRPVTGQAVPSYAPRNAAEYFKKLECFCFKQQTLAPGEVRRMPVVFVVDPALPQSVREITLSYTFFEVAGSGGAPG
jgi:cytochrome c oxidase assembly protein subunit 11